MAVGAVAALRVLCFIGLEEGAAAKRAGMAKPTLIAVHVTDQVRANVAFRASGCWPDGVSCSMVVAAESNGVGMAYGALKSVIM